jgi:hypothetical protein
LLHYPESGFCNMYDMEGKSLEWERLI